MANNSKYDFNFEKSRMDKFLTVIFGFLMYCISITLMSGVFTYRLTDNWDKSLNGQLTIEFPTDSNGPAASLTEKQCDEIFNIIRNTNGVIRVKKLKESDILRILEPWLDSTAIPDDFPFPSLFDVETDKTVNIDLLDLTSKLSKISQGVRIHNHANWYGAISKISNGLFGFSILLSVLILFTVCMTIAFITKKTLSQHKDVVKILQLVGARDTYIAAQFRKYYLSIGFSGALISVFLSVLTIAGIGYLIGEHWVSLTNAVYLLIGVIVPLFVVIMVIISSKNTVLYFLKSEEWIE